jgi:hypothetical protein
MKKKKMFTSVSQYAANPIDSTRVVIKSFTSRGRNQLDKAFGDLSNRLDALGPHSRSEDIKHRRFTGTIKECVSKLEFLLKTPEHQANLIEVTFNDVGKGVVKMEFSYSIGVRGGHPSFGSWPGGVDPWKNGRVRH